MLNYKLKKLLNLLEILETDINAIGKNEDIKTDHRLVEIKTKLKRCN